MIRADQPLIQLLALIDRVWIETDKAELRHGGPKYYSQRTMFKVYVVSLLKKLWARRSVWRFLSGMSLVAQACGLGRIPDRRTLDRRLKEIGPEAEEQIRVLGLALSIESVTDASVAASDGSAFATPGPVWHKKDKAAGIIPAGLHGLHKEADCIQSDYHDWVYDYKAHLTITTPATTIRV